MKFGPVPLAEARGKILAHNVSGPDGRRRLRKGHALDARAIEILRELGLERVYVAETEPDDVHEDEAAARVARVLVGAAGRSSPEGAASEVEGPGIAASGVEASPPHTGRVNLTSTAAGVLRVEVEALDRLNRLEGLTVATLRTHTVVAAGERVATVKVIPYALPWETVDRAEALAAEHPILSVRPVLPLRVGIVLVGSPGARAPLEEGLGKAIAARVARWGCPSGNPGHAPADEDALAAELRRQTKAGAEVLIVAGETAIMDVNDVIPRGIRAAGGRVEHLGLAMDPGHLLLLAYLGSVPVIGAPGCVRGASPDGFDAVLPRILTGERLTGGDLQELGHGGLLSNPRAGPAEAPGRRAE